MIGSKDCVKIALFFLLILNQQRSGEAGTCNSYQRERSNEGYEYKVYKDTNGIPTIGIGFNLMKSGAKDRIQELGLSYEAVLNGTKSLTNQQILTLFRQDMSNAYEDASRWLGSRAWGSIGSEPKSAIVDMAFNMGHRRLSEFVKLHAALSKTPPDYEEARKEMRNSKWCRELPQRCSKDIACMH